MESMWSEKLAPKTRDWEGGGMRGALERVMMREEESRFLVPVASPVMGSWEREVLWKRTAGARKEGNAVRVRKAVLARFIIVSSLPQRGRDGVVGERAVEEGKVMSLGFGARAVVRRRMTRSVTAICSALALALLRIFGRLKK